jgi:hypothetical protein
MFNFLFNHLNLWLKIMAKSIDLTLVRYQFMDDRTLGRLFMDGRYFCDTLEPAIRKYEEGEKKSMVKALYLRERMR